MKKLYLLICLFFCVHQNTNAQEYFNFPIENAFWTVQEYTHSNDIMIPDDCITRFYSYVGDTIIDGNIYGQLYGNNIPEDFPYEDTEFNMATATYMGAVREDADKKVWLRTPGASTDLLYYDFSLEVGDEFCFDHLGQGCYEVDYIDSMMINGVNRKMIAFNDGGGQAWVEGVGALTGWFEWQYIGSFEVTVVFYDVDQVTLIGDEGYSCDTFIGNNVQEIDGIGQVSIFPNPIIDELLIQFQENYSSEIEVEVFDLLGSKKASFNSISDQLNIDFSAFSNGIYFVHFRKDNTFSKAIKVVKKN